MRLLSRIVERLALAVLLIGGVGMAVAVLLGTGDVIGTQFFGWPVPGAKEITESTMVLIVFGALTYAQLRRGHIRVELLYTLAGPRGRAAMDVAADLAGIVFYVFLLWQSLNEAAFSWQIGETADGLFGFPLYPARWILVAGVSLLCLQLVIDLFRDLPRIRSGAEFEIPQVAAPPPLVIDIDDGRRE